MEHSFPFHSIYLTTFALEQFILTVPHFNCDAVEQLVTGIDVDVGSVVGLVAQKST